MANKLVFPMEFVLNNVEVSIFRNADVENSYFVRYYFNETSACHLDQCDNYPSFETLMVSTIEDICYNGYYTHLNAGGTKIKYFNPDYIPWFMVKKNRAIV
jgi:hypothetical protein